jgi:hypothetical protein
MKSVGEPVSFIFNWSQPSMIIPDLLGDRINSVALTPSEIQRYARHLIMPEVAMEGQRRLKAAKVLCIGTGGLGSPLSLYLAAAGVGTLGLADFDVVDLSNLQRQIIHFTSDIGRPKIASAEEKLKAINPEITINRHEHSMDSSNALDLFAGYDVIVDGTDNFPTRYLVTTHAYCWASPMSTARSFASTARRPFFFRRRARAIAACIPNRLLLTSYPTAPRGVFWGFCRA